MKLKILFFLTLLIFISLSVSIKTVSFSEIKPETMTSTITPQEIVQKMAANYSKIKDAHADFEMKFSLYMLGCGGSYTVPGELYFKTPDKMRISFSKRTYFTHGNLIKLIDQNNEKFYITLYHALDFSVGYGPQLITHNFELLLTKDSTQEIIIEGIPKPGILDNTTKVAFHIDPEKYILNKINVSFKNKKLPGEIEVFHEEIDGIWVPIGFSGRSALATDNNSLIGMKISLKGKDVKINQGLSDKIFDPGF